MPCRAVRILCVLNHYESLPSPAPDPAKGGGGRRAEARRERDAVARASARAARRAAVGRRRRQPGARHAGARHERPRRGQRARLSGARRAARGARRSGGGVTSRARVHSAHVASSRGGIALRLASHRGGLHVALSPRSGPSARTERLGVFSKHVAAASRGGARQSSPLCVLLYMQHVAHMSVAGVCCPSRCWQFAVGLRFVSHLCHLPYHAPPSTSRTSSPVLQRSASEC